MRYTISHYAQLLYELTDQKKDQDIPTVTKKFVALLKKHGALHGYKKIMTLFQKIYNDKHNLHDAEIFSAKQIAPTTALDIQKALPDGTNVIYNIDSSLIGGIKIILDGSTLVDGTIKRTHQGTF